MPALGLLQEMKDEVTVKLKTGESFPLLWQAHYEVWEHCQSISKVQAQALQNLRVRHPCGSTAPCERQLDQSWLDQSKEAAVKLRAGRFNLSLALAGAE